MHMSACQKTMLVMILQQLVIHRVTRGNCRCTQAAFRRLCMW